MILRVTSFTRSTTCPRSASWMQSSTLLHLSGCHLTSAARSLRLRASKFSLGSTPETVGSETGHGTSRKRRPCTPAATCFSKAAHAASNSAKDVKRVGARGFEDALDWLEARDPEPLDALPARLEALPARSDAPPGGFADALPVRFDAPLGGLAAPGFPLGTYCPSWNFFHSASRAASRFFFNFSSASRRLRAAFADICATRSSQLS
mmetsp:Transcript_148031/g.258171  ORF Transcript_148031/g.258171 Transcript_148031/m.258171 type:complete len:207 (-) Transcript_148031:383-1003(-)